MKPKRCLKCIHVQDCNSNSRLKETVKNATSRETSTEPRVDSADIRGGEHDVSNQF